MYDILVLLKWHTFPSSHWWHWVHWSLRFEKLMLRFRRRECDPDPINLFPKHPVILLVLFLCLIPFYNSI
jgi:hypothetical protein